MGRRSTAEAAAPVHHAEPAPCGWGGWCEGGCEWGVVKKKGFRVIFNYYSPRTLPHSIHPARFSNGIYLVARKENCVDIQRTLLYTWPPIT